MLAELDALLPPVVVHRDTMRVLDGVHRIRAALMRGQSHIEVRYFDGSEDEAFILAVQLNSAHGKPLSFAERAAAAERIIAAHPDWSDRRIAAVACMAPKTVAAIRERSTGDESRLNADSGTRIGADGRERPVNPAERRLRAGKLLTATPNAPLRQIAQQAGISLATASDVRRRVLQGQDLLPPRLRRDGSQTGNGQGGAEVCETRPRSLADAVTLVFPDASLMVERLQRDPSVRLSAAGRSLLRVLSAHPSGPAEWQQLVRGVPAHRAAPVARVARDYAEAWLQVARALEQGR
ncbi:ParB/RepB/Spo0J family partition protein [Streptomyces sp. NPDC050095]|uniref:ParB/RepB/Spo0J family partition protein n=1 Tax=unclassified Streptomyces TaxID=2593676 RepID=UPI0034254011